MEKEDISKKLFKELNIIHLSLLVMQIFFGLVTFFLIYSGFLNLQDKMLEIVFYVLTASYTLAAIWASNHFFSIRIRSVVTKSSIDEKIQEIKSAHIVKYTILESASFISFVACMLTSNFLFLISAALIVIIFILQKPCIEKFNLGEN